MVNKNLSEREQIEPIVYGCLLHLDKGIIEFPNPCAVPIEIMEDTIKTFKKAKKNNEKGTVVIGTLLLPIKFEKL